MSSASIAVELLGKMLAEGADVAALSRRYHRRLAKLLAPMWAQTTTEDLRYPGTEGKRGLSQRITRAYVDRLFLLSSTKPDVKLALFNVIAMIEPPTSLFQPKLLWNVLTTNIPSTLPRAHEVLGSRQV